VDGNAHFGSNADTDSHTVIGSASVTCSNATAALTVNQQGTGKIFELQNSGTARITVLDGGNVGIGIANPTQKLYVVGDTRIEGNLTVNGTQTVINTDVITTEQLLVTNNGTGPALVVNQTGEQPVVDIQDDGVSVMKIVNNGNIGMGTTDPTQRLHVQGSILATTQHLGPAADTSNAPGFSWSGDSNTGIYRPAADAVGVVTGGVERMRVLANGNVGIGTTNSKASMHVQSSFAFNTTVNSTNYGGLLASSAVSNGDINTYGGQIVFQQKWYSGSEGLVSTGCIAGVKTVGDGNYGGGLAFLSTPLGGDYMIERLRILDTGNVGIGTTNPQAKLHVEGIVKADGFSSPFLSVKCTTSTTFTPYLTWIKVQFNSIVKDSRSEFNNTSNSYNPKIAGYYFCNASVFVIPTSQITSSMIGIWKNGSESAGIGHFSPYCTTRPLHTLLVSGCLYMNGTTDYIDVRVLFDNGGTITLGTDMFRTFWNAFLVSPGI
jgi:hypothetical protein